MISISTPFDIYLPSPSAPSSKKADLPHYHVFFISGNPGCVGFYRQYLEILHGQWYSRPPGKGERRADVSIYAASLCNFVHSPSGAPPGSSPQSCFGREGRWHRADVLTLQEQIRFASQSLELYVEALTERGDGLGGTGVNVILVGHSVGAYIGLEIAEKLVRFGGHDNERGREGDYCDAISRCDAGNSIRVKGFVGLWPTITWISKSPSGEQCTWLLQQRRFAATIQCLVRFATTLTPLGILRRIARTVTDFPDEAVDVVLSFLQSRSGVKQALMAGDEMCQITDDKWDQRIWGSACSTDSPDKVFLFGTNDHWVDDKLRDELMHARGRSLDSRRESETWKPRMLIDQSDIPHAWCIKHNRQVAEKTTDFLDEMISNDLARSV